MFHRTMAAAIARIGGRAAPDVARRQALPMRGAGARAGRERQPRRASASAA